MKRFSFLMMLLLVCVMALAVGGCTSTTHTDVLEEYALGNDGCPVILEDGTQALARTVDLKVHRFTFLTATEVQGFDAKLPDKAEYGFGSSLADPDEAAIDEVSNLAAEAFLEAIKTAFAPGGS